MNALRYLCSAALWLSLAPSGWAAEPNYDVVVYGGTSSGVVAAVQTRRMGKTVVLIEPSRHLGGMTTGGLGATDVGDKAVIGGVAREFYSQIHSYYDNDAHWTREKKIPFNWTFEPHVAEAIFERFVRESGVTVVRGERLDLKGGVTMQATRIVAIRMESGRTFRGRMFIDATYEGDLMAKAGVRYTIGREANNLYGETLDGVQTKRARSHQFDRPVDPYIIPGDPTHGLLMGIDPHGPGEEGAGDRRVQAYNYRLCTTNVTENRRSWPRPPGYDPARYELLLRLYDAGNHDVPLSIVRIPNAKTDTNNQGAVSTDGIGFNYDYPDGDYATRERIAELQKSYQQGLMWTLANEPRVPKSVRNEVRSWGMARDEFADNDNWPYALYVRESRRMIGEYVMTEQDCRWRRQADDSIGMGSYNMDSHNVERYVTEQGAVRNEGDIQVHPAAPYAISYRAIVPKRSECTNLLVPVCLSASHIGYGSIRMEPQIMILGQSAATAAVQAIDAGVDLQRLDYTALRDRLIADKQILKWKRPGSL